MIGSSKSSILIFIASLLVLLLVACKQTSTPSQTINIPTTTVGTIRDIEYGKGGDIPLLLDIYIPEIPIAMPMPVIVSIHGGGWWGGDKYPSRVKALAERGFFAVSINYRLSGEAKFPAAVEDCKCAVRWLKANAEKYNIDPERIGVWGGSAGGHLAMMIGCADESDGLEGNGGWGEFSSRVQAVCSYYGPSDLTSLFMLSDGSEFIGYALEENPEAYEAASPINYVTDDDPPLLLVHGELDFIVPFTQSEAMYQAYKRAGLEAKLVKVKNAGHGFLSNNTISPSIEEINQIVLQFFVEHLLGAK